MRISQSIGAEMETAMKRLCLAILIVLVAQSAWGATIYVTDSTSNPGTKICYKSGAWPAASCADGTDGVAISDQALVAAGAAGVIVLDGGVAGGAGISYTDGQLGGSNQIRFQAAGQTITSGADPAYYSASHAGTARLISTVDNITRLWEDNTVGPTYKYVTMQCPANKYAMVGKTQSYRVTVDGDGAAYYSASGELTGDTTHDYITIKNSKHATTAIYSNTAGLTHTFNYPWFEGNGVATTSGVVFQDAAATVNINNGHSIGNYKGVAYVTAGTLNATNHTSVANILGLGTNKVYEADGGTINLTNCLTLPSWATVYNLVGTTDGGGNVYASPLFSSQRREYWLSITMDDIGTWANFKTLMAYAAPYKGAFALSGINGIADWSEYSTYAAAGHEIMNHTVSHWGHLHDSLNAFTITSSAGSPYATLALVQSDDSSDNWTGTLTMYEGGTAPGNIVKTINIGNHSKSASYARTIAELKTAVELQAGWSLTFHADVGVVTILEPICMASHAQQDVSGAGHLFLFDQQSLWYLEISEAKKRIETGIGGGYVAETLATPGGVWSQDLSDWVYDADNYPEGTDPHESIFAITGTFGLSTTYTYNSVAGIKPFNIARVHLKTSILQGTTEAHAKRDMQAMAEVGSYVGMYNALYAHAFTGDGEATEEEWQWTINAIKQLGYVRVMLPKDAIAEIKSRGDVQSGEGTSSEVYAITFTDGSNYRSRAGSPAINAGTPVTGLHDVAGCLDYAGNPCYKGRAPDIGAYEYQYSLGGLFQPFNIFNVFAPHRRLH